MKPWKSPLLLTFVVSVILLLAVGGWLLTDPGTSRAGALRTGGLAGGAVVALYALWLNDRRRRVEEGRHEVEQQRHELEKLRTEQYRDRASDERFAKSLELLGNDADQVRVGAMYALAGVACSREDYTQTVLDVACSYLRRPFEHIRYEAGVENRKQWDAPAGTVEQERELQVRLTAQRLIVDLLPEVGNTEAPGYDLDLTGAVLEYLDLSGRRIGTLEMRYARLHSSTNLSDCEITGPAYFTAAGTSVGRMIGLFHCRRTTFHDLAWFSATHFDADADFTGTTFAADTTFKYAAFAADSSFKDVSFGASLDLHQTLFEGPHRSSPREVTAANRPVQHHGQRAARLPAPGRLGARNQGRRTRSAGHAAH